MPHRDLGVDEVYRAKVEEMRSRLLGPKIGKWGQLQEWVSDLDDPKDQHRHFSHMIAVHPGCQITPTTTPDLAEAAKISMNARGDASTGLLEPHLEDVRLVTPAGRRPCPQNHE